MIKYSFFGSSFSQNILTMEKYIFFETEEEVGFCPSADWEKYKYENNITPIRQALVSSTSE